MDIARAKKPNQIVQPAEPVGCKDRELDHLVRSPGFGCLDHIIQFTTNPDSFQETPAR